MGKTNLRCPFSCMRTLKQFSSQRTISSPIQKIRSLKKLINTSSGFCVHSVYVENPLKLYRGKDRVNVFCDYVENEAERLPNMFPESQRRV